MDKVEKGLAGYFLIADLNLTDPHFLKSVILVLEHSEDGAVGLIINRPIGLTAAQIVHDESLPVSFPQRREKIPLLNGGPVEPQAVFTLHTGLPLPYRSSAAKEIIQGVFFEPSFPALSAYVTGQAPELPPDDIPQLKLYLGYAGWAPGQLEKELQQGTWQLLVANSQLVFQTPPPEVWTKAMEKKGGFWSIVAQTGFKPSLN